ncbi:TonB-dependent receptor [Flavobacteriaceae bacterium]|nr:TonB-dependent receptor [Flavobacteriaceae bacterium]
MKIIFRIIILSVLTPLIAFSQSNLVTGTVNDESGLPLPGVTVQVKDSDNLGAVTNFDGVFTIAIPSGANQSLVLSYVGYATEEVDVSEQSTFSLNMQVDTDELEEVVVIGYGTVLKKDISGSISSVSVNDEVATQSNSVDQLLQGRASGVQVIQNSAAPGSGISVKIRGTNSLRGNNEPLYVIDGIIISSAGEDVLPVGTGNTGQQTQNGLNGINPRDIESIQVLKDASATAIYGSRGANGVVLITTKKGTSGKAKISAFLTNSVRSATNKIDVLDAFGFAEYINELDGINGFLPRYSFSGDSIFIGREGQGPVRPTDLYNWQDEIYGDGFSQKFGASASGGGENGNYYISAGFDNQQGVVRTSTFKSSDIRINLNQNLNENLKLQARISGFMNSGNFAEGGDLLGGANTSFVRNVISYRPIIDHDLDDVYSEGNFTTNPFAWQKDFSDISKEVRFIGSVGLTYKLPVKGLSYEIKYGGNIRTKDRRRFYGLSTFQGLNSNGTLQISTINAKTHQFNNIVRFNRKFNRRHRVNAMVGLTYDVRDVENSIYAVEDFLTMQFTTNQPAYGNVVTRPLTYVKADQQIFSMLGRVNYTFDNKYILTATVRRDGVSKFADNNQYGVFPSIAFAWNAGNERFIQNLDIFESLKFRAGWGQIGNHGIGPYGSLSNYGVSNLYGNADGGTNVPIALQNLSNPDLTWETTEQSNFGVDFTTLNGVVSGNIDVYDKMTKDLLQNSEIPPSSGFTRILVNKGNITNKGVELALNITPISTDDVELSFGGNISFNKTQIVNLESQPLLDFYENGVLTDRRFYFGNSISRGQYFRYPANVFVEGEESSLFYGFETDGIYQTEDTDLVEGAVAGDVRRVDQLTEDTDGDGILDSGDGIIDEKDRTFIGNPNPDYVYGFNFNLRYKGWNISALFNGVYGNDIANGMLLQLDNAEGREFANIMPRAYYNAWRPDSPSNTHPRIGYRTEGQIAITDRIIEDGSYLRLNNLTIGYDIPVSENKFINNLNVYIAGQNLFTWTNYSGYDPEVSTFLYTGLINGVDWNSGINARNVLMGVNIKF